MTFFKLEWWIWNILALDANFEFWKMFWMKSSRKVTQHVSRHILISLQHISLRRLSRVPWLSHAAHQVSQTLYRSKRWLQGRHQNYYYLRLGSNLKFWYLSLLQPALLKDISFRRIGEHSKTCHSSERFASHQFQQLRNFNRCVVPNVVRTSNGYWIRHEALDDRHTLSLHTSHFCFFFQLLHFNRTSEYYLVIG